MVSTPLSAPYGRRDRRGLGASSCDAGTPPGALTHSAASGQDPDCRFDDAPSGVEVAEMLATLAALRQAWPVGDGRYVA